MSKIPNIGYFFISFQDRNLIKLSFKYGIKPKLKDPRNPWVFFCILQKIRSAYIPKSGFLQQIPKKLILKKSPEYCHLLTSPSIFPESFTTGYLPLRRNRGDLPG